MIKFQYISVAAQLPQDPRFYKFQLYTAIKKRFHCHQLWAPKTAEPGCSPLMRPCLALCWCWL